MRKTPHQRPNASKETRHHLLFEKPEWTHWQRPKQVRELGSYIVGVKRAPHDYIHQVVKPVDIPPPGVLDVMMDVGREYIGWQNDQNRIDRMMDTFAGYAIGTRSPQNAEGMLHVMSSIEAQMSIIGLFKGIRGIQYE